MTVVQIRGMRRSQPRNAVPVEVRTGHGIIWVPVSSTAGFEPATYVDLFWDEA